MSHWTVRLVAVDNREDEQARTYYKEDIPCSNWAKVEDVLGQLRIVYRDVDYPVDAEIANSHGVVIDVQELN
jgi:hypothetical protein